jgi:hypothetical protein
MATGSQYKESGEEKNPFSHNAKLLLKHLVEEDLCLTYRTFKQIL